MRQDTSGETDGLRFIEKYRDKFPSPVKAFIEDLDALLNHLRFPFRHRRQEICKDNESGVQEL